MACQTERRFTDAASGFQRIKELGEGTQGTCSLVKRQIDGKLFVCKVLKNRQFQADIGRDVTVPVASHPRDMASGVHIKETNEINILMFTLPQHPRIISLLDCMTNNINRTELLYEFCDAGDLATMIAKYDEARELIPEAFIWHVFLQLSQALAYIHYGYDYRMGLLSDTAHKSPCRNNDVKPGNIFLRWEGRGRFPAVVLGDFGHATTYDKPNTGFTRVYAAPEAFQERSRSRKMDVWSMGATIHELCLCEFPGVRLPARFPANDRNWRWWKRNPLNCMPHSICDAGYSQELQTLMNLALTHSPPERPTSLDFVGLIASNSRRIYLDSNAFLVKQLLVPGDQTMWQDDGLSESKSTSCWITAPSKPTMTSHNTTLNRISLPSSPTHFAKPPAQALPADSPLSKDSRTPVIERNANNIIPSHKIALRREPVIQKAILMTQAQGERQRRAAWVETIAKKTYKDQIRALRLNLLPTNPPLYFDWLDDIKSQQLDLRDKLLERIQKLDLSHPTEEICCNIFEFICESSEVFSPAQRLEVLQLVKESEPGPAPDPIAAFTFEETDSSTGSSTVGSTDLDIIDAKIDALLDIVSESSTTGSTYLDIIDAKIDALLDIVSEGRPRGMTDLDSIKMDLDGAGQGTVMQLIETED